MSMRGTVFFLLLPALASAQQTELSRWSFASANGTGTYQNSDLKSIVGLAGAGTSGGGNSSVSWAFPPDTILQGTTVSAPQEERILPRSYSLDQNYPNPFNPSTVISWEIPLSSWVTLKVYDLLGREVALLQDGHEAPGKYTARFNAEALSSGVYIYRLQVRADASPSPVIGGGGAGYTAVRKMIVLR
jgi:hypothetical protein